jgi:hypothetical protein
MGVLSVLHSIDGKEFITQKHMEKEIYDELYVHDGRETKLEKPLPEQNRLQKTSTNCLIFEKQKRPHKYCPTSIFAQHRC